MRRRRYNIIAYILWLIFGAIGGHRFYFRKFRSGFAIIAYQAVTIAIDELWWRYGDHERLSPDTVFWGTLAPLCIFLLYDAFWIPAWTEEWNNPFPESPVEFLK